MLCEFKKYLSNVKCYSKTTIKTYMKYIDKLEENNYDYKVMLNLHRDNSNNTKRVMLSAIKAFYKFTKDDRFYEIELPKKEKKVLDYLSYKEYQLIIKHLHRKPTKNFSKIIITKLLFETGIRSSELLNIEIKNIDENKIKILGKNNKERIVYISHSFKEIISSYIKTRKGQKYLFNFSYKYLHKVIGSFQKVINKKLTPHMFRRGFATYCIDNNIGIYELSLMMGHDNINTTRTYLRNEHRIELMKNIFN